MVGVISTFDWRGTVRKVLGRVTRWQPTLPQARFCSRAAGAILSLRHHFHRPPNTAERHRSIDSGCRGIICVLVRSVRRWLDTRNPSSFSSSIKRASFACRTSRSKCARPCERCLTSIICPETLTSATALASPIQTSTRSARRTAQARSLFRGGRGTCCCWTTCLSRTAGIRITGRAGFWRPCHNLFMLAGQVFKIMTLTDLPS